MGGKVTGVDVGWGVGKGGRAMGVGVKGIGTGVAVGWGVTVGAAVLVGTDAKAVAKLSFAIRRMSSSERAHAESARNSPTAMAAVKALFTAASESESAGSLGQRGLRGAATGEARS